MTTNTTPPIGTKVYLCAHGGVIEGEFFSFAFNPQDKTLALIRWPGTSPVCVDFLISKLTPRPGQRETERELVEGDMMVLLNKWADEASRNFDPHFKLKDNLLFLPITPGVVVTPLDDYEEDAYEDSEEPFYEDSEG